MKILVLGATGMAGHTLAIYFKDAGYDVTTFSRRQFEHCNNIIGDITDLNLVENVVQEGKYDAVINAVGILNKDAEDNKSLAVMINSFLPHFLSNITKNLKTKVIHMSTDCVFQEIQVDILRHPSKMEKLSMIDQKH
ncbi:sugar nucleotide-binding protein [Mesobacillus boroniphilus]|uniref:dTDP-4-dehydrorhamnose reductase n=1 Tax=Mesobacillus boroniphilus JCM 21738 TaxID=1294265 RepID=W4RSW4_9BACI|nr:sugar nucleotide-binding protein [Mesobacillus boroniphilus]GAE46943.1 dTDP-4-dehydrorhamnose reductase [Mesobacillus boroniphilus JCM 21738]